jgi:methyl-accepting chemotaxis protein
MVEETTAAAQALSAETEQLAALTRRFRTRAGGLAAEAAPARAPHRPVPATSRPVAQMRSVAQAKASSHAAAAEDNWEEF